MINNRVCYLYSTNLDLVTIHKHCQCQLDSLGMWYMLEDVLEGMLGGMLGDVLGDVLGCCGGCLGEGVWGNVFGWGLFFFGGGDAWGDVILLTTYYLLLTILRDRQLLVERLEHQAAETSSK